MSQPLCLLSIPGLRAEDLSRMPRLAALCPEQVKLSPSFPAVTCPVQANLTTGALPAEHGVIANGFYWRDRIDELPYDGVQMWTAWDEAVQAPRVWDRLKSQKPGLKSAVWFPLLAKGCGADFVCTPAPIHNPDGSELLWCYTKPEMLYGELRDAFGHFPLQHFWGPMAGIQGSEWIVSSLLHVAAKEQIDFAYVYLPHLDYAAQKEGPDSEAAYKACEALDAQLGRLADGLESQVAGSPAWLVASEYAIQPVSHVSYPNRLLREAGLLEVKRDDEGYERIDHQQSKAWALVDHQHGHLFVRDRDPEVIKRAAALFSETEGIAEVLVGQSLVERGLAHERTGDLVLVSAPHSWQAYYYWLDDELAPTFSRTVDIHNKPGYDPVEMFYDPQQAARHGKAYGTPLDASLVRGSHGAAGCEGVLLASSGLLPSQTSLRDVDVAPLVLSHFGCKA